MTLAVPCMYHTMEASTTQRGCAAPKAVSLCRRCRHCEDARVFACTALWAGGKHCVHEKAWFWRDLLSGDALCRCPRRSCAHMHTQMALQNRCGSIMYTTWFANASQMHPVPHLTPAAHACVISVHCRQCTGALQYHLFQLVPRLCLCTRCTRSLSHCARPSGMCRAGTRSMMSG
jgi:hypothetical protein